MAGAEIALEAAPRSVPLARRWLRDALGCSAYDLDVACLLLSELVTNVLLHARSAMTVRVLDDGTRLRVEVSDAGPSTGQLGARGRSLDAEHGRGLAIVEMLAAAWGVTGNGPQEPGRRVWFELPRLDAVSDGAQRHDASA